MKIDINKLVIKNENSYEFLNETYTKAEVIFMFEHAFYKGVPDVRELKSEQS